MNNKGFTLVELLLTIVVLSMIILIAVPSISSISNQIRENQRKNNIKKIEIAAAKYAFDTGETIIFVDKLITEGYLESDNEDGDIDDPLNNNRMNCYIVKMEKVSDYYKAKFIDGNNYEADGSCDLKQLKENNAVINIEVINNGVSISNVSSWLKGNVTLRAYSDTVDIDCKINKCVWSSSTGASLVGSDEITINNITRILDTKYTFQVTVYGDDSEDIKRYTTSLNLKIDNEVPEIYNDELNVTDEFIYTSSKTVSIKASDGKGSGIMGYYLGSETDNCLSTNITFQENNSFLISSNGTYKICVKDNVGNISSSESFNISYIE